MFRPEGSAGKSVCCQILSTWVIPEPCVIGGENWPLQVVLWLSYTGTIPSPHPTQMNIIFKFKTKRRKYMKKRLFLNMNIELLIATTKARKNNNNEAVSSKFWQKFFSSQNSGGDRRRVQWLGTLVVLPETRVQSCSHVGWLTAICLLSSSAYKTLVWPLQVLTHIGRVIR